MPATFEKVFREFVPDLARPDANGWARGKCPYCGAARGFVCNVFTGKWSCFPEPPPRVADSECGRRRLGEEVERLRRWCAAQGIDWAPLDREPEG
jgi:hypothetical protein